MEGKKRFGGGFFVNLEIFLFFFLYFLIFRIKIILAKPHVKVSVGKKCAFTFQGKQLKFKNYKLWSIERKIYFCFLIVGIHSWTKEPWANVG